MSDVENETFIEKFHLSKETFNALYELVLCRFVKKSTHLRETIPGKKRLGFFLEWMAHSDSFGELAKEYRIVHQPCMASCTNVSVLFLN